MYVRMYTYIIAYISSQKQDLHTFSTFTLSKPSHLSIRPSLRQAQYRLFGTQRFAQFYAILTEEIDMEKQQQKTEGGEVEWDISREALKSGVVAATHNLLDRLESAAPKGNGRFIDHSIPPHMFGCSIRVTLSLVRHS